jgi:hypothetical protein
LIGASNKDITLLPWQMDKFIFVKISKDEGIDLSKAIGYTPRSMDPSIKKTLRYIGKELLIELEKLIPEINNLRNLSRDEIRKELVKIGYKAWTSLYKKYGLEPFPEPSEPETEIEKENVEELYRDVFITYISKILAGDIKEINSNEIQISPEVVLEDPSSIGVEEKLKRYEIIVINYKDYREVTMKKSLLSKFIQYAKKEYGLPEIGIGRLMEILGLKETTRKIAGKSVSHLIVIKI